MGISQQSLPPSGFVTIYIIVWCGSTLLLYFHCSVGARSGRCQRLLFLMARDVPYGADLAPAPASVWFRSCQRLLFDMELSHPAWLLHQSGKRSSRPAALLFLSGSARYRATRGPFQWMYVLSGDPKTFPGDLRIVRRLGDLPSGSAYYPATRRPTQADLRIVGRLEEPGRPAYT